MWEIEKDIIVSAAHKLNNYDGKCKNLHGHSWHITIYCKGNKLNKQGILVDFALIKKNISDYFDHKYLNELFPENKNPTAENLAERILEMIPLCHKVMVEEEKGSRCYYVKSE